MKERGIGFVNTSYGRLTIDLNDGKVLNHRIIDPTHKDADSLHSITKVDLEDHMDYWHLSEPNEIMDIKDLGYYRDDRPYSPANKAFRTILANDIKKGKEAQLSKQEKWLTHEEVQDALITVIRNVEDAGTLTDMAMTLTGAYVEWAMTKDKYRVTATEDYGGAFGDL